MIEKLVRDNIPEIIRKNNKECKIRILKDREYKRELISKLIEEFNEYLISKKIEELIDLVEVVYAILDNEKILKEEFEKIRIEKLNKRGGFKKRIFLISIKE